MLESKHITRQIAYLTRLLAGLCFDYTLAYYADDEPAMHYIRAEYRLVCGLIRQLRRESGEIETLRREQVAAVEAVERMLRL